MGQGFNRSVVRTVQWKGHQKVMRLSDGRLLILPLSACVTVGEVVRTDRGGAYVECDHGFARLLPIYAAREVMKVGALKLEFLVKEITEASEMDAYRSLTSFHYRDQPLFGRTARLIVQTFHPSYPRTIGYIELATPFYMSKPRNAILDRPFRAGSIEWERWNKETARRAINLLVRIARCVIYPEFRGLGLGQTLVAHAMAFARTRWQVGGIKPQFIEISADMLKYVPFAERAGLHFIGDTQGNLDRVATDLEYLLGNRTRVKSRQIVREEAFGIVDQQVARMDRATALMKRNGWSRGDLIERLRRVHRSASLRDLSLLQRVLSLPKPTYLGGLTREADKFVREGVRRLKPKNGFAPAIPAITPLSRSIDLRKLTIVHSSTVRRSQHTSAVQHAFGISPEAITHEVISDLSFSIAPGQIAMIVGPSGSGKTTFLKHLAELRPRRRCGRSKIDVPVDYRPGLFGVIRSKRPLIDALHAPDVASALQLMGLVSLSDAFVYLKRFEELSAGQQYRAMLAKLIAGKCNVWIVDEFGVNLDPLAANSVAHRLGKLARRLKVALVVATPQPEVTARSLLPDIVVRLTTARENEVLTGAEFLGRLPKAQSFRLPSFRLSVRAFNHVSTKKSNTVVLPAQVHVRAGPVIVESNGTALLCNATAVDKILLHKVSAHTAKRAGYRSKEQFVRSWRRKNPGVEPDATVSTLELVPISLLST